MANGGGQTASGSAVMEGSTGRSVLLLDGALVGVKRRGKGWCFEFGFIARAMGLNGEADRASTKVDVGRSRWW